MKLCPPPSSLALLLLVACASPEYRVDAGLMVSKHRGSVALQDAGGSLSLGAERNNINNDLDVGSGEPSPYLRFQLDEEEHRVRVHGFGFEGDGRGVLAGDFGNIASGSLVSSSLQFLATGASYSYGLLSGDDFRVGVGGQLTYLRQKIGVSGPEGRERLVTDVIVPMPFAEAEWRPLEQLAVGGNAGLMYADLGDGKGRYWDVELWGRWQLNDDFSLLLGYRYLLQDARGRASGRDFDADINVQGLFLGGGIRF